MKSNFDNDLKAEQKLARFLDKNHYTREVFNNYDIERVTNLDQQHKGIDLIIRNKERTQKFLVDEKAQLNYVNQKLPTFAFELSYLKNGNYRKGWLFDKSKLTDKYFLITSIKEESDEIQDVRLISIDRQKLIHLLETKGLSEKVLNDYDSQIRVKKEYRKKHIPEIDTREGYLFYTEFLNEQPLNIVLYLNYLIEKDVGKEVFPSTW